MIRAVATYLFYSIAGAVVVGIIAVVGSYVLNLAAWVLMDGIRRDFAIVVLIFYLRYRDENPEG